MTENYDDAEVTSRFGKQVPRIRNHSHIHATPTRKSTHINHKQLTNLRPTIRSFIQMRQLALVYKHLKQQLHQNTKARSETTVWPTASHSQTHTREATDARYSKHNKSNITCGIVAPNAEATLRCGKNYEQISGTSTWEATTARCSTKHHIRNHRTKWKNLTHRS